MAALPYMPLYVADYLSDTAHLTLEQHGAYLKLIMIYWQRGKPLPADDAKLARIVGATDVEWTLNVRSALVEFFDECDGEWRHHRIDAELDKIRLRSEKAAEAGKKSGLARNRATDAERSFNDGSTDVQRTLNHTDTDTDTKKKKENARHERAAIAIQFEAFWAAYPKRKGSNPRQPAHVAFERRIKAGDDASVILNGAKQLAVEMAGEDPRFIPQAATWLNQRRWEEYAAPPPSAGPPIEVAPQFETEEEFQEWWAKRRAAQ